MAKHARLEPPVEERDGSAEQAVEWLGSHASATGAGVTLVFVDGSTARIDAVMPESDTFRDVAQKLSDLGTALNATATNSDRRW